LDPIEVTWANVYVISRYINYPLLIDCKKFDLRVYVFVKSFQPICAYM
jgi:hypothetical protein